MIVKEKLSKRAGCEREWARTSVSSRGKNDTKRNLVRATTKSRAGRRQSLMDVSVEERGIEVFEEASQCQRPCQVSRIEFRSPQSNVQWG